MSESFVCNMCKLVKIKEDYMDNGLYEIMKEHGLCADCMNYIEKQEMEE